MLIPDSLRQEDMPMMVYALCRIVKNHSYNEEQIVKALSVTNVNKDETSSKQVANVLNFAKKAEFVYLKTDLVCTDFTDEELQSPKNFSFSLLKRIDLSQSEKYANVLRWFLWKGKEVEALEHHKDIRVEMLEDPLLKQMNISEDFTHGFLFWTEFLGMATHSIQPMGCYNYSLENILIEYIKHHREQLKAHGNMPVLEFFNLLSEDLFFIPICYAKTEVCYSLSFALRVLEKMNIIDIEDKNDGSMTWHLERSSIFKTGNSFTNIKVR